MRFLAEVEASPLEDLAAAVEGLQQEDLERFGSAALAQNLGRLFGLLQRLESEFTRRVAHFDRGAHGYACDNLPTVAWLRLRCRLRGCAAAERVRVGRQLEELPETAAAFSRGEISYQHAAVLSRCAEEVGTEPLRQVESALVEAAREVDPGRLRLATRYLRHCLDPDGSLSQAEREFSRRHLYLSQTLDGLYVLDGLLDVEGGETLRTALEALMGPPAPADRRSSAQRRADALVELARCQLDAGGLPETGGEKPHLTLVSELRTLRREPQSPPAELDWRQLLPGERARRLACDVQLTPVLVGADWRPLAVGRSRRVVSSALRRALHLRDRGCRWPGCDRPPAWTDAHHIRHWVDGGETNLANTVLLCRRHHSQVHEHGWRLEWQGGELLVRPP